MLKPSYTNQFQKDIKLMGRRGKPLEKFKETAGRLISREPLEPRLRNHKLTGNYKDRWECHLEPDWLLIYKLSGDEIIFERTGSHSDLFE
ncbi:MAG TPA: type II toxin-antitoxin system YafQ family toxin [Puia sp.]|nr:type II toxin-antitoxin system YafQ family toxin [Puia sp.]